MIVKSVFILFDLTMDILFVIKNGKDVPWLYIPSITILIVPLVFNMVVATMLITHELRENCSFIKWFNEYKSVISIFTICSGADISLFEFLMSRFAGFEIFNAPFSNFTLNWIYLGTVINTLIEEIPQLIVQILYFKYTVKYEAIPFLTLLTGSISLLNNIIFKLFKCFSNKQSFSSKNKVDDFYN
ncbi:hypothetical protein C2G38_2093229, partial [Gigaspora rosea]